MRYNFDWDPAKEKQNTRKHKVAFRRAATVFRDPNQLSIYDEEHSKDEDRWITIGIDNGGILRVVIHMNCLEPRCGANDLQKVDSAFQARSEGGAVPHQQSGTGPPGC